MRKTLVAILVFGAVLAAGCTSTPSGPKLTSTAAIGDPKSVDYCSLLDVDRAADGDQVSGPATYTLTGCRAGITRGDTKMALTVSSATEIGGKPYAYKGDLPNGVTVEQSDFDAQQACVRLLVFSDGGALTLAAGEGSGHTPTTAEDRCAKADLLVAGAVDAITAHHVGQVTFDAHSYGSLDPCSPLADPALDAVLSPDTATPKPQPGGHSCLRGALALQFGFGPSVSQATTTVAGRAATVSKAGPFCQITATEPAPGKPWQAQSATVQIIDTAGEATDQDCALATQAATVIFAKLPASG